MSSFIDPQYVPVPRAQNEFLAVLPNVFDPTIPVPMNVTPDEVNIMFDALLTHRQKQQQMQAEECNLYGGSTNPIPSTW